MNRAQALAAVRAAGIPAVLTLAQDECEDDQISLHGNESIGVQISATRDGLRFSASVVTGEGADLAVTFGAERADPVAAARDALRYAAKEGLLNG